MNARYNREGKVEIEIHKRNSLSSEDENSEAKVLRKQYVRALRINVRENRTYIFSKVKLR